MGFVLPPHTHDMVCYAVLWYGMEWNDRIFENTYSNGMKNTFAAGLPRNNVSTIGPQAL